MSGESFFAALTSAHSLRENAAPRGPLLGAQPAGGCHPAASSTWRRLLPALSTSARAWVHWAFNAPELLGYPRGQKIKPPPLGRWRLPRAHFKNHFETAPPLHQHANDRAPRGPNFHKYSRGTPPERRPI